MQNAFDMPSVCKELILLPRILTLPSGFLNDVFCGGEGEGEIQKLGGRAGNNK